MNKIYIVFEDNGEMFEDYEKWVVKVFNIQEQAMKFIENSKAKEQILCKKQRYREKHNFWVEDYDIEKGDSNVKD